jgi:hypothetical protein
MRLAALQQVDSQGHGFQDEPLITGEDSICQSQGTEKRGRGGPADIGVRYTVAGPHDL